MTTGGFGKQVILAEFPVTGRNGLGVVAAKIADRSGEVAGAALVEPDDLVACVLSGGAVKVVTAKDLPEMGRPAFGKAVLELAAGQKVQDVFRIARAVPEAEIEVQPAGKDGAGGESEDDQDGDDGATGGQAANGATGPRTKPTVEVKGPTKTKAQPGARVPAGAAGRVPAGHKTVPPAATTGTAAPPSAPTESRRRSCTQERR